MRKSIGFAWRKTSPNALHAPLQTFQWLGTHANGQTARGTVTARTALLARAQMKRQGIVCNDIRPMPYQRYRNLPLAKSTAFAKQLAALLGGTLTLVNALEALAAQEADGRMKAIIEDIHCHVGLGHGFSEALQKHPHCFSSFFCQLVHAGEQSAALAEVLQRIAAYQTQMLFIRNTLKKALTYPLIVLFTAMVVTGILLAMVIPSFQSLFDGLGAPLPWLTRQVVNLAAFTHQFGGLIAFSMVTILFGAYYLNTHYRPFSEGLDALSLKLPFVGTFLKKALVARFASTLSLLFASGMPLMNGLILLSNTLCHATFTNACDHIAEQVHLGESLHHAMKKTRCFPPLMIQMTATGEACGNLSDMLQQAATLYERELNDSLDAFSHLLEPIIMALLGVLIGTLVIAMYLPVFQLGSHF